MIYEIHTNFDDPVYTPHGGAVELFRSHDQECIIGGPAECVAGETLIEDAITGKTETIKELCDKGKAPMVRTLFGSFQASVPFKKGIKNLYRVTTESGQSFLATKNHLVLTPKGWTFVGSLQIGEHLLEYSIYPVLTNSALAQLSYLPDDRHLSHNTLGFQERYSGGFCRCDEPFPSAKDNDQSFFLQQGDALGRNHDYLHRDDREFLPEYTLTYQPSCRLSNVDFQQDRESRGRMEFPSVRDILLHDDDLFQLRGQCQRGLLRHSPSGQQDRVFCDRLSRAVSSSQSPGISGCLSPAEFATPYYQQQNGCFSFSNTRPGFDAFGRPPDVYSVPFSTSVYNSYYTVQQSKVSTVEYVRTDEYYDMSVPGAGHYFAEGFIHHNTGKTLAACWKSHILASKYPGCQGAIVRKTQSSVYGSVLQTFERVIKGAPVKPYGGTRPEQYIYANGSIIWVGGMDNPDKLLSSERDFVQVNQTEELKLDDWEKIMTRVTGRAGNIKHPQVFGDCNPAGSKHWIRERGKSGSLRLIVSTHKDNPTLFDPETGAITVQGERTMEILNNLTGVRRKRLLEGIWATAEGAVYDMFDASIHVKERDPGDFHNWILGIDEGYTNPAVILLVGIDGDGRLHIHREFYRRGVLQSVVVAQAAEWCQEFKVEDIAVDNSAAGLIADLVDAGLPARGMKGRVLDRIQTIQNMLKVQGDGLPRLTASPTVIETINEFESYVWKPEKDEPVKEHDHSMDGLGYIVLALQGAALEYGDSPTAGYRG